MRRRLVYAIVGITAAAVLLFALPLAVAIRENNRTEGLLRLERDTVAATREIDLDKRGGDPIEIPRSDDDIAVYDRTGNRLLGRGPSSADALVRSALRSGRSADRRGDGRLYVAAPLLRGERVTGAVRATRADDSVAGSVRDAWLALAGVAALVIALAAAAALLVSRRLARPLERLAAAARRLGDGDFAARAPAASIPEVDAVGRAFDATAVRLGDLVMRERQFTADASHQLRTPLAALRLELEAMELRGEDSPELRAATTQVDRLQRTIDTLLHVVRDAPRAERATDLVEVLGSLEARWRGPLAVKSRPLRTVYERPRPTAAAAPGVVEEIVEVLIANAHDHGAGAVSVTVRDTHPFVSIDVGDEGAGLSGSERDAFTRRASTGDGEGIGLALARSLAVAEGGDLTVSASDRGACFTLRLPAGSATVARPD